jgi:hypothetical protein
MLAVAAVTLGRALQINNGFYDTAALGWLTAATIATTLAALFARSRGGEHRWALASRIVLIGGLVWQFASLLTARPLLYAGFERPSQRPIFYFGVLAAAALSVIAIAAPGRLRRAALVLVLLTYAAVGVWVLRHSPDPRIDVVVVHREAIRALAHGRSPYSISFPNVYPDTRFYGAGLVERGRVHFGLPYPPLSLLMAVPGAWFGDYRLATLAALVAAAALIAFGRVRSQSSSEADDERRTLAALILLFTPRTFFLLEQGWTEPFFVLLLAATVYSAHSSARANGVAAGLLCAIKQYVVVLLPLAWLLWRGRNARARLATATIVAAIVTLPFIVWDASGFMRSVVLLQFQEPFRLDSLSYLSWMGQHGLEHPHLWITLSAVAIATAIALWRLPSTPSGFAVSVALVLIAAFGFGKKAFCNYYFGPLAAVAIAIASTPFPQPAPRAQPTPVTRDRESARSSHPGAAIRDPRHQLV